MKVIGNTRKFKVSVTFKLVMFWFICHCLSQTERDQRDGKFLID